MKKNGSRWEGARGLHGRGRRFRPARSLSNILCFQVDPKVGFVRWVWRLVLVRIVSIVMDSYSIDFTWSTATARFPSASVAGCLRRLYR